jgi:hypothetical protein
VARKRIKLVGKSTIKNCSGYVHHSSCNVRTNDVTNVYELKDILMSKQIGSNEKPVMFRKTIAGKGSRARPGVYSQEYRDNFDKIFNKKKS